MDFFFGCLTPQIAEMLLRDYSRSRRPNKVTGANSRPASQFESRELRRRALVVERRGRYDGGAAVAQLRVGQQNAHSEHQK